MDIKELYTIFRNHTHTGSYPDAKRLPASAIRFPGLSTCIGLVSSNGTRFLLGVDDDGAPTLSPVSFTNLLTSADGTVFSIAADSDGAIICGPASSTFHSVSFRQGIQLYDALGNPFVLFPTNDGALATMAGTMPGDGLPVGAHVWMAGPVVPFGFLREDGGEYLKADYPALAAFLAGLYGSPSDADHFCVPNVETDKRFIRGGAPAAVGQLQADAFKLHGHTVPNDTHRTPSSTDYTPGEWGGWNSGVDENVPTSEVGDTETRPINVTFLPCIKW